MFVLFCLQEWMRNTIRQTHISNYIPASFDDHQLRNMAITKSSPTSVKKMLCSVISLFFLLAALFMSANAQQTPTISYITPNLLSKVKKIKNTLYLRIFIFDKTMMNSFSTHKFINRSVEQLTWIVAFSILQIIQYCGWSYHQTVTRYVEYLYVQYFTSKLRTIISRCLFFSIRQTAEASSTITSFEKLFKTVVLRFLSAQNQH